MTKALIALLALLLATPTYAADSFSILALSWEPAFCEAQARTPECEAQTPSAAGAKALSLHGLWPQREYCGVARDVIATDKRGDWSDLPPIKLDGRLAFALSAAMPGAQSDLHLHEWTKHGTCSGMGPQSFFYTALKFLHTVNTSPVATMLAGSIGKRVTQAQIRAAFDQAFGRGAGDRVRIACAGDGNRRLVTEITIGLWGDIAADADLASLILAARPTDGGCTAGIIDPVGLQ